MYEKSTVVGLICLAILATVIGSGLARSVVSNATNVSLSTSNTNSTNELASYRQATITVMAATAMMATAIGLAATLRQQASSEVDGHRKRQRKTKKTWDRVRRQKKTRDRNDEIHSGAVTRPPLSRDEKQEQWDSLIKFVKEKTENGADIEEWKEIEEVIRAEIEEEKDLERWAIIGVDVRRRIKNGSVVNWEYIKGLLGRSRVRRADQFCERAKDCKSCMGKILLRRMR